MRVGPSGGERPATLDVAGRLRDLSTVVGDRSTLGRGRSDLVAQAQALATGDLPYLDSVGLRIGARVASMALEQSDPQPYRRRGDVVELEIDGLGRQRRCLVATP
jgi:hypothetical protein